MRALLLLLAVAGTAWGHGGTTHSAEMAVDNELVIAPRRLTVEQIHRCRLAVAEGIWRASDADRDGTLSDAELAKAAADSQGVYQQWCRVDADWKLALPAKVDVELTSFPRTRPATFGGIELAIRHHAVYELPAAAGARSIAFNCTSLNARTVRSKVRAVDGVRIESTSLGKLDPAGLAVDGAEQVDGTPDQLALLVRDGAATAAAPAPSAPAPAPASPAQTRGELALGGLVLAAGFWMIVARAVAIGRLVERGGSAGAYLGLVGGFALVGAGAYLVLRALVLARVLSINP